MTQALKKKKSPKLPPKVIVSFRAGRGHGRRCESPALPSRLQAGSPARAGLSRFVAARGARRRAQEKAKGQEPGWHLRKAWLCVCVVCVPGGWDPCEPGGESAHTDGRSRVCVCTRPWAVAEGGGDSLRCSKQDTAASPHASRLQGQRLLHSKREGT